MGRQQIRVYAGILSMLLLLTGIVPVAAETPVGSNIDSRVVLAFKVDDAAVTARLPDDWGLVTLGQGPLAGTNLLVAFIDRHLALDPAGTPRAPHAGRSVALLAYAARAGVQGAQLFVLRVYETPPVDSDYGNGIAARIGREMGLNDPDGQARRHHEAWTVAPETGGTLSLELAYQSGRPGWSSTEAITRSAVNPAFYRIYRYDQLADLAMSTALGRDLAGEITFRSAIPELADMFDGSEMMTGVLVVPVYIREVALP